MIIDTLTIAPSSIDSLLDYRLVLTDAAQEQESIVTYKHKTVFIKEDRRLTGLAENLCAYTLDNGDEQQYKDFIKGLLSSVSKAIHEGESLHSLTVERRESGYFISIGVNSSCGEYLVRVIKREVEGIDFLIGDALDAGFEIDECSMQHVPYLMLEQFRRMTYNIALDQTNKLLEDFHI